MQQLQPRRLLVAKAPAYRSKCAAAAEHRDRHQPGQLEFERLRFQLRMNDDLMTYDCAPNADVD